MDNKPLYFDSWKGMVARAIVLDGARTWTEIRDSTGLPRNSFNRVLGEMLSSKALEKKDDKTYRLSYNLYKEYDEYYQSVKTTKKAKISQADQDSLIAWLGAWKDEELKYSGSGKNFFVKQGDLEEVTKKLIRKAKAEVLLMNPFVNVCNLTDEIINRDDISTTVVCRKPGSQGYFNSDKVRNIHDKLKENISLFYHDRIHAKMLVVDRSVGIISSMNFTSASSSGSSYETGIVTTQEDIIQDMLLSIENVKNDSVRQE